MQKRRNNSAKQAGTTLLELLISVALMVVMVGGVMLCLNTGQKSFRRSEVANALDQQLRAAQQLLAQDISQAGLTGTSNTSADYNSITGNDNPTPMATLTMNTTTSTTTPTVSSTNGMFVGQTLLVGTGSTQESIIVSAIPPTTSSLSFTAAAFGQPHSNGEALIPHGIFAEGITPSSASGYQVSSTQNNAIWIFGDLQGNGTVSVVKYACPISNSSYTTTPYYTDSSGTIWAPLIRTEYDNVLSSTTTPTTPTSTMYLLDLVAVNSNGCFNIASTPVPTPTLAGSTTLNYVTLVSISIRAMAGVTSNDGTSVTPLMDPDTHQPVTASRSFLDITPRNILASLNYAKYCSLKVITDGEVMPTPTLIKNLVAN